MTITDDAFAAQLRVNAAMERAMGPRVRIAPSYLVQGSSIEGVVIDEGDVGIAIQVDDDGEERFYPWTSVAYVVRDPKPEQF